MARIEGFNATSYTGVEDAFLKRNNINKEDLSTCQNTIKQIGEQLKVVKENGWATDEQLDKSFQMIIASREVRQLGCYEPNLNKATNVFLKTLNSLVEKCRERDKKVEKLANLIAPEIKSELDQKGLAKAIAEKIIDTPEARTYLKDSHPDDAVAVRKVAVELLNANDTQQRLKDWTQCGKKVQSHFVGQYAVDGVSREDLESKLKGSELSLRIPKDFFTSSTNFASLGVDTLHQDHVAGIQWQVFNASQQVRKEHFNTLFQTLKTSAQEGISEKMDEKMVLNLMNALATSDQLDLSNPMVRGKCLTAYRTSESVSDVRKKMEDLFVNKPKEAGKIKERAEQFFAAERQAVWEKAHADQLAPHKAATQELHAQNVAAAHAQNAAAWQQHAQNIAAWHAQNAVAWYAHQAAYWQHQAWMSQRQGA